jgi:hypothetical protein
MAKTKKSVAGHVVVWMSLDGEIGRVSRDLSAKTVVFYQPVITLAKDCLTGLYGLKNGSWKGKLIKRLPAIADCQKTHCKGHFIHF